MAQTHLEPLSIERAEELFGMMRDVQNDPTTALALDDDGRVVGVVGADDPVPEHVLGDLDVHA